MDALCHKRHRIFYWDKYWNIKMEKKVHIENMSRIIYNICDKKEVILR